MTSNEEKIVEEFTKNFSNLMSEIAIVKSRLITVKIQLENLLDICHHLKEKMHFNHISSISGVDYGDHFSLVYHIYSYSRRCTVTLNMDVPKENPTVASVTPLWGGANWHERETYDLFGIVFENHPNLERILTPPGWEYFPLRKEYKLK
ncbi:MAG: NADH-quinone oxidoreductase subunit C [Candidatus Bathyarchaeota archaeon]